MNDENGKGYLAFILAGIVAGGAEASLTSNTPGTRASNTSILEQLSNDELRSRLTDVVGNQLDLEELNKDDLVNLIVNIQTAALSKIDPNFDPEQGIDFYDYWDDWNINNWGDFFDHDFDNT